MKTLQHLILFFFLAAATFSCEKEMIQPEAATPQLSGFPGLVRPATQCGSSAFSSIVDDLGGSYGTVEIVNDAANVHVLLSLNASRFLDEAKFFAGDANQIDFDGSSLFYENFQFQSVFSTPQNRYTFVYPISGLGACTDLVFWGRISIRNQFGGVTGRRTVWLSGLQLHNIQKVKYCFETCGSVNPGNSTN